MADAADIGANFSSYRGDANLGGGNFGVVEIDTKPLQNLAAYTMLYNKEVWKQKQQETDLKVKELADLSKISLNSLRAKDKVQATKEFSTLIQKFSEYARKVPKTEQEKIQNELEIQTELGKFNNNYNSGKTRAVTYAKRYSDIMGGTQDAKQKDIEIEILNKEFDDTDIGTQISAVANFKTGTVDIPPPTPQKFQSIYVGGNENLAVEGSVYNPKTNAGIADATILGVKKLYPKEGTDEYKALSEAEKNQAKIQATVESGGKVWVDATEPLNAALKPYVNSDGIFDSIGFENDNASNTTLMNAYNGLKNYGAYNRAKYEQAKSGIFNDKGLSIKLPDNLNPEDFKVGFVDFSKGVNPNQLVQSGMFAKYQGDSFTKKITETDNQIQRDQLGLQWYNAKSERIRANKPDSPSSAKAPDLVTQPALLFGEHINRLKTHFNKTGNKGLIVSYEATDEITRKALGLQENTFVTYKPDGTAMVGTDKDGRNGTPLTIEQQKNNFIIAVKGGSKEEAQLDAKFLGDAETGIQGIFGTTSGTQIWNNWGATPTKAAATTTEPAKSGGMTDAQFQEYLKKKGLKK